MFPATASKDVAAGIKVNLLISAVGAAPGKVLVRNERTPETKLLKVGSWVRDRLLLMDLGYFKYHAFVRIDEQGGFFVTRLRDDANPVIRAAETVRGNSIDVVGEHLQDVLPRLHRQVLDCEVEVAFKRRRYKGNRRSDTHRFRLVALRNEDTGEYHAYLTNLPDDFSAEEVGALYGARWQVELVFKELKSKYALDKVELGNRYAVEALVWGSILTLLVSRRLRQLVVASVPVEDRGRYPPQRWSQVFLEHAEGLLEDVLVYYGYERLSSARRLGLLEEHGRDPHTDRERLIDRLVARRAHDRDDEGGGDGE